MSEIRITVDIEEDDMSSIVEVYEMLENEYRDEQWSYISFDTAVRCLIRRGFEQINENGLKDYTIDS